MGTLQLFISHSERDKPLVSPLERWLRHGLGLSKEETRCTVVTDAGMPIGSVPVEALREDILEAAVVVVLLTSTSLRSHWVQLETGAAWVQERLHAIRGPGITPDHLPSPLNDFTTVGYCEKDKMQSLLAQLATRLHTSVSAESEQILGEISRAGQERLLGDRAMWFSLPPVLSAYSINANSFTGVLDDLCKKLGLVLCQVDTCVSPDGTINRSPDEMPVWALDVWNVSSMAVNLMICNDTAVPRHIIGTASSVLSPKLLQDMQCALSARTARATHIRNWFRNSRNWIASNMPTEQGAHGGTGYGQH